jgi:drug/metabolite transporter (DMT)-like permease
MASDSGIAARLDNIPAPIQGALYMIFASACFAVMNVLIRLAATELEPLQIAFLRNFFALSFMMPWLLTVGLKGLATRRLNFHIWRGVIGFAAMVAWFTSVARLPLSEAVALNFTVPLFATVAAAVFLKEIVRARRWSATAAGFLGVLIILRPGLTEFTPLMALPIVAAAFMAASITLVKRLSDTEDVAAIVLYQNLVLTIVSIVPALFVWRWPSGTVWLYVVGVGFVATIAHLSLTRAYTKADASAVIPFDYARLPFVALLAFFLFGETADVWTWVGAGVIAASSVYIARREAAIAREARRRASRAAGESAKARP